MTSAATAPNGLVALLDRLLDSGVVVAGQVQVSLADIELIGLDLRVLLTGVESARRRAGLGPRTTRHSVSKSLPPLPPPPVLPERVDAAGRGEDGIARLVLVLVELLREVLASQAVARLQGGSLADDEVERLGRALMLLEQRCDALRQFVTTDPTWSPYGLLDRRPHP